MEESMFFRKNFIKKRKLEKDFAEKIKFDHSYCFSS
jgi:hypothetical protein